MSDKNQAMIDYLMDCEDLTSGTHFFNYADEHDNANHIVTIADDKDLQKPFIDGSVMKQYTFQIICYRPLSNNPLVDTPGFVDENLENMAEVQAILDWIEEQEDNKNYPDFGEDCFAEKIYCMTDDPNLYAIDTEADPPLAKYSVVIRFEYLDTTKQLFKQ